MRVFAGKFQRFPAKQHAGQIGITAENFAVSGINFFLRAGVIRVNKRGDVVMRIGFDAETQCPVDHIIIVIISQTVFIETAHKELDRVITGME